MPKHNRPTPLPLPVTQTDLAGLLAVAEFLDQLEVDGDAAPNLRSLAERLSPFVPLTTDAE